MLLFFIMGLSLAIKVKDLCKKIILISGKDLKIIFNKAKPSIPFNMYLNCNKAKKDLDWKVQNNIDLGIKKSINWWRKNIKK